MQEELDKLQPNKGSVMNKEDLEKRLAELNAALEHNMKLHHEMLGKHNNEINESASRHNMLLGQINEVKDWLQKLDKPAE